MANSIMNGYSQWTELVIDESQKSTNPFASGDTIWYHSTWSTLVQAITCFLTVPWTIVDFTSVRQAHRHSPDVQCHLNCLRYHSVKCVYISLNYFSHISHLGFVCNAGVLAMEVYQVCTNLLIHLGVVIAQSFMSRYYIDGLVQDCSNSIANALELLQSCTKQSICNAAISKVEHRLYFELTKNTISYPHGWIMGCLLWKFWSRLTIKTGRYALQWWVSSKV